MDIDIKMQDKIAFIHHKETLFIWRPH